MVLHRISRKERHLMTKGSLLLWLLFPSTSAQIQGFLKNTSERICSLVVVDAR